MRKIDQLEKWFHKLDEDIINENYDDLLYYISKIRTIIKEIKDAINNKKTDI